MNTTNKKTYTYKMNLGPANILCIVILILVSIPTMFIVPNFYNYDNLLILFVSMVFYFMLHEFIHGIGYFIGGTKRENISYGICLEKGIFYAMAYQKLTKKNILISLQMPFMVIGVITYVISLIFNLKLLLILSVINICGAAMDLAMFIYFLKLPKDIIYSESGNPDEFVVVSDKDLTKKKSLFFRIVEEKDYKEEDFKFKNIKKINITKTSVIILIVFILLGVIGTII